MRSDRSQRGLNSWKLIDAVCYIKSNLYYRPNKTLVKQLFLFFFHIVELARNFRLCLWVPEHRWSKKEESTIKLKQCNFKLEPSRMKHLQSSIMCSGTCRKNHILTLFRRWRRGGRGGFCQHGLWTFITFVISKLKPPNLVTCPKIYLGTIWYSKSLSIKFDVTMATTFWQAVFSEFCISLFFIKYAFLVHFCVNLLILITA